MDIKGTTSSVMIELEVEYQILSKKYIHSSLNLDLNTCTDTYESCTVEIYPNVANKKENITIFAIYRPPNLSRSQFIDSIDSKLGDNARGTVAVVGDLNIELT